MAKAVVKKEKRENVKIVTPIGMVSFPYLAKPDTGRKESSNKYSVEIFIPKAAWQKQGKELVEKLLGFARVYFDDPKLKKLSQFKNFITDMDTQKDIKDYQVGTIRIRAKAGSLHSGETDQKPTVIGAIRNPDTEKFDVWTDEQIAKIKGGDFGRIIGNLYGYTQQGGGISLALDFFQFQKEGKAIGQGKMKAIEDLDELEVEVDSADEMVDTDEPEEIVEDDEDEAMNFG